MKKKYGDEHIGKVLNNYLSGSKKLSDKYILEKIRVFWKKEMGELLNSYTQELRYAKGILHVYITSAPLKNELVIGKEKMRAMINKHLEAELVKKIYIA